MHHAAWLVWISAAATTAIVTTNPIYLALLLSVAWVVYAAKAREGPGAASFKTFVLFDALTIVTRTALVLFGSVNVNSIVTAMVEGFRLATLLTLFGTFNAVTDPHRVVRLAPGRWHEPALAAGLALSIAPRTIAAAQRVREAQKMRGIEVARWRTLPALAVPVLESGMEEAMTLAESMDARGHGRGRRSRYRPERWDTASVVSTVGATIAAGAFVLAATTGERSLTMPTFPLAWPVALPLLIAAVAGLALPAFLPEKESR